MREEMFQMEGGMTPLKLFPARAVRFANVEGMIRFATVEGIVSVSITSLRKFING